MSVNRFEIQPFMLCVTPDAQVAAGDLAVPAAPLIIDISKDWTSRKAQADAQALIERWRTCNASGPVLLRIAEPDDISGHEALGRLVQLTTEGFVLSGCRGVAAIQKLDVMLRCAEAQCGLENGSMVILAEVGEMPEFFVSMHSMRGISERLKGIVFDGAALTQATMSQPINMAAGRSGAPLLFARAATVLRAKQADLPCYEFLADDGLSESDLLTVLDISRSDGFSGVIARNAAQFAILAKQ